VACGSVVGRNAQKTGAPVRTTIMTSQHHHQGADDEWIFSLRVPSSAQGASVTGGWVQLRQRQPSQAVSPRQVGLEEEVEVVNQEEERAKLLPERDVGTSAPPAAPAMWKLESPFWSLQSEKLLSITYYPAWQALPEYTEQCSACCPQSHSSFARICGVKTCGKLSAPAKDFVKETFTVEDIVKIEHSNQKHRQIQGVGLCQTVKVFLRPMTAQEATVPSQLKEAWERHVEDMREGRGANQASKDRGEGEEIERQHDGPVITFCMPSTQTDPPLLWKVALPEISDYPIAVETITVLDGCLRGLERSGVRPTHIYINGYQSWSFAGSLLRGQPQPGPALPSTWSRAFNVGGSPPPKASTLLTTNDEEFQESKFKKHYQSDFFTCITSDGRVAPRFSRERRFPFQQLDETGGPALLLGWLSQHEQFGVINVDKELSRFRMHCSLDGQILMEGVTAGGISTDWGYAQLVHPHSYDEEPMANFLHSVAAYNHAVPLGNGSLLTGWCSWYVFYENINAGLLRSNFSKLAAMRDQVPTNVSVVDDGYMTAWGDWASLKPKEFPPPGGVKVVARDIAAQGMRPGLWLAPFAADKHSQLVKDHPDWVIRNDSGIAANSANCGKFFFGLDATNPEVRKHVHASIRRAVHDWGFDVLKIDFLYACCLEGNGKYDLSISRAHAMHLALQTIRDAAGPDVFLIGCGCPIATGIGYIDAMRISADTGPTWYAALPLPWWDNGTLPSLRGMIRNTIARAPFGHRWWHNDPDCLMLGSHTSLTDDEVASAASIVAMTCGMLLLSDDLPAVSSARMSIVSKIFPLTGVTATVLDLHSTNDGLPSLLRLWCTDRYDTYESFADEMAIGGTGKQDANAEATFYARKASFRPDAEPSHPTERTRSCIHVAKGMGTWTVVSLSNWSDKKTVIRIPPPALLPPPTSGWSDTTSVDTGLQSTENGGDDEEETGYHVFGFWSSKYSWLANPKEDENDDPDHTVCKLLRPHETEVFHIKRVTPDTPQYIGKSQLPVVQF